MTLIKDGEDPGNQIAIVGLACRYPGDVSTPTEFWDLLEKGINGFSPSSKRFNAHAFYHPSKNKLHTIPTKGAHYLSQDISTFDANFFNITHAEAMVVDPQQRLALELCFEAFENAGITMEELSGSPTGCFMGCSSYDWHVAQTRDIDGTPRYVGRGAVTELISNRVSWFLNLKGPSMTVNTACSSSLVAMHLACQSIRAGESTMVAVGGVNMMLGPEAFMHLANQGFLSSDGICKTFDATGDGYGRGEGCGVVILKRLDDALHDGNPIRAIIRGSGCNQDGFTQGISLPSADAQASLIRDVYARAGLSMGETQYVECHGTGTKAGDPIELRAIGETIGQAVATRKGRCLIVGSVKPNIGHLEAGSGVAGVIKGVLALERGLLPPNLYFRKPNPSIHLDAWNLSVPTELLEWPSAPVRRMSVNSFGMGGTNAHVILEDGSRYDTPTIANGDRIDPKDDLDPSPPLLFVLSASDQAGIVRSARTLSLQLQRVAEKPTYLGNLAYTLGTRRSRMNWKSFYVASSRAELVKLLGGEDGSSATRSHVPPRIGFVFTGQGAQWARMGTELARYAIFQNTVDAADTILAGIGCSWSVWDELRAPVGVSRIDRPEYSQPICTILQIALVELLASWNVVPERVVGHSSGEIAAAYCAGVISMRDAIKIAYFRGTVSAHISGKGGMMAVGCSVDEAEHFISQVKTGKLVVSCINSPKNVTISGDIAGLAQLQSILKEKAVFSRQLKVDNAYHSSHMQQVADIYGEMITSINTMGLADHGNYDAPIMISSVQAGMVGGDELGPAYWVRNMISPVLFDSGVREFVAPASQTREGPEALVKVVDMVVEVGPHPALQSAFTETVETLGVGKILYHSALRRGQDAIASALELAGALYARGCRIDMAAVNAHSANSKPATLCDLRPYPWNHTTRYWPESRQTREFVRRDHPRRSLLGAQITQPGVGEHLWRGYLRLSEEPWIRDHNIHSSILYPATAYLVMVIEAARQLADPGKELRAWKLRDIRIPAATVMTESVDVETSVHLRPHLLGTRTSDSSSWWEFSVSTSQDGGELQQKCHGLVSILYEATNPDEHATRAASEELQSLVAEHESLESAQGAVEITSESFYHATSTAGLLWGDKFRNITRLRVLGSNLHVTAEVTVPEHCQSFSTGQTGWTHLIHPATLDSILQPVCGPLVARGRMRAFVPQCIDELEVSARISSDPGTLLRGYCAVGERGLREVCSDITFFDEQRSFVAVKLRGYSSTEIQDLERDAHDALKDVIRKLCARTAWEPAVDLLTGDEMARLFSTRNMNQSADSDDSSAAVSAVMAMVHCDPSVSILEVADQTFDSSSLLRALERTCPDRPAGSYTIAMPKLHGDQTDSNGSCSEKEEGLHVLDLLECDDAFPATRNSKFDIVAISSIKLFARENAEHDGKLLSKLTRALNSRGRVVCEVHRHLDLSMVQQLFSDNGYKYETPNDSKSCLVFSKLPGHDDAAPPQQQRQRSVLLLQLTSATETASGLGSQVASRLREAGLNITARSWDDEPPKVDEDLSSYTECISLLELEHPFLQDISAADYASLKTVILHIPRMIWVTGIEGPSAELMVGMARTVRNEMPDRRIQTLKLSGSQGPHDGQADLVVRLATSPTSDDEFCEQDGVLHVSRVVMDAAQDDRVHEHTYELTKLLPMDETPHPLRLAIRKAGLLDTLYFHPDDRTLQPLGENEVEIEVKASGVNFRDIMCTMGILPDTLLGCEASGIVRRAGTAVTKFQPGDRVCAQTRGAHATVVRAHESMCEMLPDTTSFAEGAAIGVVHCTAYHALVNLARLRPGQSVLIHSGAGGVGQAAIQLAQHLGLRIYTTVGSREKRALLRDEYGLRDDQIFSSRDTSFVTGIKRATDNRGVDCVLNSLAGELLRQSFYCLAPFGTFVEIGMRDVVGNTRLDMLPFAKQTTFTLINLWAMMEEAPQLMQGIVAETFANLRKGIIRAPVPLTVYPVAQHQDAFRLMQAGKHQGKLVLSYEGPNEVPVLRRPRDLLQLDPSATYLLVGGLGGLGRSLASMMISSGARHLAFLSRHGAESSAAAKDTIDKLRADGCTVQVYKADVADRDSLNEALRSCALALPPIRGVVQMAMVLRDGVFANMTHDQWREATRPKVQGTWNLHEAFPCHHDLDFFIILSSCASVFGNRGQANYAAAGAYQDGLARHRRQLGLKAVSVDLGIMLDVGVLAEKGAAGDLAAMEQHLGIHEYEFHGLMRAVINGQLQNEPETQIITGLATSAIAAKSGMPRPAYLGHPRFSHLALFDESASQDGPAETVGARLREAKSKDEIAQIITHALIAKVAEILRTPESEIDPARPLYTYGVDSLVAMEVRSWIVREIQVDVSLFEILLAVPMEQFAIGLAGRKSIGSESGDGAAKSGEAR
ncbi:beta-ketoacyl synthase domain-containing protein [Echria macrotheca]|uniref:Beta-ketoacyl synthase domain-containing protein n=1 Tax=Echria macrotheca TaxID=438768 RepID=A0AAJ0F5W9_9PEZI|nr:beta-ketoacyl synthase domain-containing protein [Echria macrotheca]